MPVPSSAWRGVRSPGRALAIGVAMLLLSAPTGLGQGPSPSPTPESVAAASPAGAAGAAALPGARSWEAITGLPTDLSKGETACAYKVALRDGRWAVLGASVKDWQWNGGLAWSSADGRTWVPAPIADEGGKPLDRHAFWPEDVTAWRDGFAATIRGVINERGRFVPVKHPLLLSETGGSWTVLPWTPPKDVQVHAIAATPEGLVMTGAGPSGKRGNPVWLFTSSDGVTWEGAKAGGIRGRPNGLLLPSFGGYLVSGYWFDESEGGFVGYLWYSPDGSTWSEHVIELDDNAAVVAMAETPAGLLALVQWSHRDDPQSGWLVLRSIDGVTWEETDVAGFPGNGSPFTMVAADGGLVSFVDGWEVASEDGVTWTGRSAEALAGDTMDAELAGSTIVAVGCTRTRDGGADEPRVVVGTPEAGS
jgi:hypothetical protein